MHHGIAARQVGRRNGAQILVERVRCRRQTPVVAVQPPIPVVAGIEPEDPDATLEQIGREHRPEATIHPGAATAQPPTLSTTRDRIYALPQASAACAWTTVHALVH